MVPPPIALGGVASLRARRQATHSVDAYKGRAAEYVRMSTEHQRYSTENQAEAIRQYAERRGLEVIRTYADEGKSGLRIAGRDALKRLIEDVQSQRADFSTILVYDVSRWGRFQDADESAYYEYVCRRAGITVQYCAEQFENDGSPVSTIVKGVKRAMAGEYSRELSAKVFAGQCRLIEIGFRQGGPAGYGLRRMLVDQTGTQKGVLRRGEHKSIQTDRVILVPGEPVEIDTVHWMYRSFVEGGKLDGIGGAAPAPARSPNHRRRAGKTAQGTRSAGRLPQGGHLSPAKRSRLKMPPRRVVSAIRHFCHE